MSSAVSGPMPWMPSSHSRSWGVSSLDSAGSPPAAMNASQKARSRRALTLK
jgi:hypothetical protein